MIDHLPSKQEDASVWLIDASGSISIPEAIFSDSQGGAESQPYESEKPGKD